jgi:tetratricopeptide (TPR) repeat protein
MGKAQKKKSGVKRKKVPAGKRSDFHKVLEQGEKFYLEGNLPEARNCFTKLLEAEPDNVEVLNNLGVIAFQERLLDEALSFFQKALNKEPGFYDAVENTAKVLEAKGEYIEALNRFRNALEIGGLRTETLNSMARCLLELDDRKTAGEVLKESLTLNPEQAEVKRALENLGRTADIPENKIRKPAKKLNIGFVSIWFERGQSYVTKTIRDVLAKEHNTFVFARTGGVYGKPISIQTASGMCPA